MEDIYIQTITGSTLVIFVLIWIITMRKIKRKLGGLENE